MSNADQSRILAVEIRAAHMGYVVLEAPNHLLDFGAVWFNSPFAARSRINRLLEIARPSVLVVGNVAQPGSHRNRLWTSVITIASSEAAKVSVPVVLVSDEELKAQFARHSCSDKYEIATLVAKSFPAIAWRLPSRRKFYEPESRAMIYFDTAALATAYIEWAHENNRGLG